MKDAPSSLLPLGGPLAELLSSTPDKLSRANRTTTTWRPFRRAFRPHCRTMQPAAPAGLAHERCTVVAFTARRSSRRAFVLCARQAVSRETHHHVAAFSPSLSPSLRHNAARRTPLAGPLLLSAASLPPGNNRNPNHLWRRHKRLAGQSTLSAAQPPPANSANGRFRPIAGNAEGQNRRQEASATRERCGTRTTWRAVHCFGRPAAARQEGLLEKQSGARQSARLGETSAERYQTQRRTTSFASKARCAKPHLPDPYSFGGSAAARQTPPTPINWRRCGRSAPRRAG